MAEWQEEHPKGACDQEQHQYKDIDGVTQSSVRSDGRAGELAARPTVRRHDGHLHGGHLHKKGG